ncbi:MAG TPA: hypothetical protein VOB72_24985 [Candidatus Dormibacteraeota bacterium]|nr:hypothetical protein [Candidatus Dormibacteraeota bacterium]
MGAAATLLERSAAVEPGGEAAVQVRVRNAGQVVDQFALQVLGAAATWATVEPPSLSLFPGGEEVATVRFRPPRSSGVAAGEVPFGVRVVSREDPDAAVVEEGTLRVGAFFQTVADLVPRNSRGSRSAAHELAIDNHGNVPVEVAVQGADPDGALGFGFRPPSQVIEPGRAGFVRVRVTARRTFLSGPPQSHPFQLRVLPYDQPPMLLDGGMLQGPLIGRGVRNAALLALAGVVAAALLWFLALKPGVESTARQAVAAPLAQQSAAIAQLQKQAPGGGGAGAPAAGPTAGSAGAGNSGGSAASGAGTPFARRLDQSGPGRNQYKVPAGVTLSVTDVVFQNPGADHGTVQLQRDGATLLVENLDNFRDLDYHVVTPITATANQTVQLTVSCPSGCAGAGVLLNGTERPS